METANISNHIILAANDDAARSCSLTSCNDKLSILQSEDCTNISNLASKERLSIAFQDNVSKNSLALREAVERNSINDDNVTNRTSTAMQLAIDRNGSEKIVSSEKTAANIVTAHNKSTNDIHTKQQSIAGETRTILQENNMAAGMLAKKQVTEVCNSTNHLIEQGAVIKNSTALDVQELQSDLKLLASKNNFEIELNAVKTQAMMNAETEDCCCEIKEEVAKKEMETQKIARNLESQRIRGLLSAANTENLINQFKNKQQYPSCYPYYPYYPCYPPQPPPQPPMTVPPVSPVPPPSPMTPPPLN